MSGPKMPRGDVAIVGMACRLPGAADYRDFWRNLRDGVCSVREIPPSRWDVDALFTHDINEPGKATAKWGGLLEEVDQFDHAFFGISPREARSIDPQQRLLLQEAWRCVEDSAIPLQSLQKARTNVAIGLMALDYYRETGKDDALVESYACLGNYGCILANRLSHFLQLRGESKAIDTACSSSLVAIHDARRALLLGDCDFALAGGVSLILNPFRYIAFSKSRMLSPDGLCKTFDASANGYVPGEGVALLLLRRLEDALADGNTIHAVIRGSAVNHNAGGGDITAPNVLAQVEVVRQALDAAGVTPREVSYVEAHGTGTSLGDPIEVEALSRCFGARDESAAPCVIGSVKTNIGHLEAAAGIAGVIKVMLMMKHRQIARTLHLNTENPLIDFARTPFRPALQLAPWDLRGASHRIAGVSSFGFGGVNAHLVLQEHQAVSSVDRAAGTTAREHSLALSARSPDALGALVERWATFTESPDYRSAAPDAIEATLLAGRAAFSHRVLFDLGEGSAMATRLRAWSAQQVGAKAPTDCETLMVVDADAVSHQLTLGAIQGAGAEPGAEQGFFASLNLFRHLARIANPDVLTGAGRGWWVALVLGGWLSEREALVGYMGNADAPVTLSHGRQPLLDPDSGTLIFPERIDPEHLGAIAASPTFSQREAESAWENARRLVAGQYTFRHFLDEWKGLPTCDGVSLREAFERWENPRQFLGEAGAGRQLPQMLVAVFACLRRLHRKWNLAGRAGIEHEGTSLLVDLLADTRLTPSLYLELAADPAGRSGDVAKHLDATARRSAPGPEGVRTLGMQLALTVRPGEDQALALQRTEAWIVQRPGRHRLDVIGLDASDPAAALKSRLLALWAAGAAVDWAVWFASRRDRYLSLPTYRFAGRSHWLPGLGRGDVAAAPSVKEASPRWALDARRDAVLRDHVIAGQCILPAAAMVSLAVNHLASGQPFKPLRVENAMFVVPAVAAPLLNLHIRHGDKNGRVELLSGVTVLFQAGVLAAPEALPSMLPELGPLRLKPRGDTYAGFAEAGYGYGPGFRIVHETALHERGLAADLSLVADPSWPNPMVNPGLLDGVFQSCLLALEHHAAGSRKGRMLVPAAVRRIVFGAPLADRCTVIVPFDKLRPDDAGASLDAWVVGADGTVVAALEGIRLQFVRNDFLPANLGEGARLYVSGWQARPAATGPDLDASATPALLLTPRMGADCNRGVTEAVLQAMRSAFRGVRHVEFDPAEEQVAELVGSLREALNEPVSLWFLAPQAIDAADGIPGTFELAQQQSADALFLLMRELLRAAQAGKLTAAVHVRALSQDAWVVQPGDRAGGVAAAGYAGLARALRRESRRVHLDVIDLDEATLRSGNLAACLAAACACDAAPLVTYRQGVRHVPVTRSLEAGRRPLPLRAGGVYLVTGGRGGIGRHLTEALLRAGAAAVVVAGRGPAADARSGEAGATGRVFSIACDVGDEHSVVAMFGEIGQRWGRLDGVFHGAGVTRDSLLAGKSLEQIRQVCRAKTVGTLLLERHSRQFAPSLFVAFSSVVGWIGNAGQTDYAAANVTMDALVARFKALAPPLATTRHVSVAWTLWSDGGMGIDEQTVRHFSRMGLPPIGSQMALAALWSVLSSGHGCVAVCAAAAKELDAMLARPEPEVSTTHAAQLTPTPPQGHEPDMHSIRSTAQWHDGVRAIVAEVLDVDPAQVEPEVALREYGVDSVSMSLIAERLGQWLGEAVIPSVLIEHPSVGALVRHLSIQKAGDVAQPARQFAAASAAASAQACTAPVGDSGLLSVGQSLSERMRRMRLRQHPPAPAPRAAPQAVPEPASNPAPHAVTGAGSTPAEARLTEQIQHIVADVLSLQADELDLDTPLREYGIDSVSMSLVVERMRGVTGLDLFAGVVLEHPTLRRLAAHIGAQLSPAPGTPASTTILPPAAPSAAPPPHVAQAEPASRLSARAVPQAGDAIAVIGRAGRMPQADDIHAFWRHLREGRDLVREVPASRWSIERFFAPGKGTPGRTYSKWAGLLDDVRLFDARFFGLDDKTAAEMDPQQRIFLELVQHLWDDAGYTRDEVQGTRTGVFVGATESNYGRGLPGRRKFNGKAGVVNVIANLIPGRVSDFYDLRGPSLATYTACSSSLVALHQAVTSLQRADCDMAIAGGIELLLDEEWFVGFSEAQALSLDGRCKVFDESANGFVLGEGAGAVLLKRLDRALADGDRIHAVLEAVEVNNDGRTMGLTTPNAQAQQELIERALTRGSIDPASISCYEAHGTGTALGDPIEILSATRAFRRFTNERGYCALGSVKSNTGHLLSAAGMASLLKVLMCMHHGELVPTLHCLRPHPKFEFESTPFVPIQQATPWQARSGARRAAISSFGFGGTNVHVVLRDAPAESVAARRRSLPVTRFDRRPHWLAGAAGDDVDTLMRRLFDSSRHVDTAAAGGEA